MGLGVVKDLTVFAILCFVILGVIAFIAGCYLFKKLSYGCYRLLNALLRAYAISFVDFATYLYAKASKAISSRFSSTSELPHLESHRRRDLIGGSASLHEYPGVISNNNSCSERILNRYGRYMNLKAEIPDTNATIFRIRSWLRNCERNHNGQNGNPHCQPLDEEGRGYPLWLIDIEQRCVVPFQATLSYFALSYVWGQVQTAKMERSNHVQLQQPGSLLGPHQAVVLPKTIKDAMFLTGFLGHRYLWCDRLCLVQDDISSKLPQIQHMAEIYSRAYCTIVAFDNLDANSGLHGLPCLTRCSHQQVSLFADTKRAGWSSRAWTFQEELFSVRIIQLSLLAVNWQCSPLSKKKSTCGSNHNNSGSIRSLQFKSNIGISKVGSFVQVGGMFCPRHASLEYYMGLAEKYSQRQVSALHPEDIFHAFSSVQSILKASYPGAFIQGIPECLLVQCLLWQTSAFSYSDIVYPVTGRKASSWSWIAWSTPIDYPRFADEFRTQRTCEGLVSWYVSLKKDSCRYPVSVAKEERWVRHKKVEGRFSASRSPLNASSSGMLDMSLESQGFEHIVPHSAEPSMLEVKNLCSFLHGRVLMARFRLHIEYPRRTDREGPVRLLLRESTGNYAGVLCGRFYLNEHLLCRRCRPDFYEGKLSGPWPSDLLKCFLCDRYSSDLLEGQKISLIAISRGSNEAEQCCKRHHRSGLEPEDSVNPLAGIDCRIRRNPEKKVYEFYDALWVECEVGVVYRRGIGRVCKEVWDRETLGWVDITLG